MTEQRTGTRGHGQAQDRVIGQTPPKLTSTATLSLQALKST